MGTKSHWTDEHDSYLASAWKVGIRARPIAATLGRTERAVKNRVRDHHPDVWAEVDHPDNPRRKAPKTKAEVDVAEALANLQATMDSVHAIVLNLSSKVDEVKDASGQPEFPFASLPGGKAAD